VVSLTLVPSIPLSCWKGEGDQYCECNCQRSSPTRVEERLTRKPIFSPLGPAPALMAIPMMMRPMMVTTLMRESQNSAEEHGSVSLPSQQRNFDAGSPSPYALTPRKLMAMMTARKMEIHTAGLTFCPPGQKLITRACEERSDHDLG
jgi:hypothetical protein